MPLMCCSVLSLMHEFHFNELMSATIAAAALLLIDDGDDLYKEFVHLKVVLSGQTKA